MFLTFEIQNKRKIFYLVIMSKESRRRFYFFLVFNIYIFSLCKGQVVINEVSISNTKFTDENGDSPDWFEIYNPSGSALSTEGWHITDDELEPLKWSMPTTEIGPGEYRVYWASGKDIRFSTYARTIIDRGDSWRYIIPTTTTSSSWIDEEYSDVSWFLGQSGFGYGDNDDHTIVPAGTRSIFLRKKFTISNVEDIEEVLLDIDYDDGFVAYVNGVEIARANIEGERPPFNALPETDREATIYNGVPPVRYIIPKDILKSGSNTIAIQAHNISNFSSDFTIIPFLTVYFSKETTVGEEPPSILNLGNRIPHTNFKLSDGERLVLSDNNGIVISELALNNIPTDVSYGLSTQEENKYIYFDDPTPGERNGDIGYESIYNGDILYSKSGGPTTDFELELSTSDPNADIRYTTDATIPNSTSTLYDGAISIDKNMVIRAKTFKEGSFSTRVFSQSYLVEEDHDIPIVSIISEPDNFFGEEKGIYVLGEGEFPNFPYFGSNIWEDWERPASVSLYETDGESFDIDLGVKIFGGWSRAQEQRSLSFFSRRQYGYESIDYRLFPDKTYGEYQSFVLRNSGNDFVNTNIRDAILTTLMDGSGIETQSYRSVAAYINGEYWGMYNMREKVNEHFLNSSHGVPIDEIDLIGPGGELIHGTDDDFLQLMEFLENNFLTDEDNYNHVKNEVDIDNFIMYQLAQIYFNNTDWPGNNIKLWKHKNGKWRWILYDTDFGFGIWNNNQVYDNTLEFALDPNGPDWPNPPSSTLLFRRLMGNLEFRNKFINQFADEMNTRFLPENVKNHIDKIQEKVINELPQHYSRWGVDLSYHHEKIDGMKNFANIRPTRMKVFIRAYFNLSNHHEITMQIDNPDKGSILLNSLTLRDQEWKGDYFEKVPIKITAQPKPGFKFIKWEGDVESTQQSLELLMTDDMIIKATFEEDEQIPNIVINEINYNSSNEFDSGDWVELYNGSEGSVDLKGWVISDNEAMEEAFVFEEETILSRGAYIVIAKDKEKFSILNSDVEHVIGNLDFGFSKNGDNVFLYQEDTTLHDYVVYLSESPWPEKANGTGSTLELKDPMLDNEIAENWKSNSTHGTPGRTNISSSTIETENENFLSYYPNPFSTKINIEFFLDRKTMVKLSIVNVKGEEVVTLINRELLPGNHVITENIESLAVGVYFLRFRDYSKNLSRKWIKY